MKASNILIFILVCTLGASSALAVIYPFEIFTDNGNFSDSPSFDMYMDVGNGDSTAKFTFYNDSLFPSTLTAMYFDDGPILGSTMSIINGPGTSFAEKGVPTNIPGGNIIGFVADREFSIDADPSPMTNGIDEIGAGEWATVQLDLVGYTLQDVLDALDSGTLRVGIKIQGLMDGSSESAVNVPEPATVLMLGLGGLVLRRKRKK